MMMKSICKIIALVTFCTSVLQADEPFVGDIYLAGTNKGLLLFQQRNSTIKNENETILRHTYTDPQGNLAVREDVVYKNGIFSGYIVEFAGTDCGCKLKRSGDKLIFGFTQEDKSSTGEDSYYSNLVMGPTLTRFVHEKWPNLLQGNTEYLYIPAMTLQKLARFKIARNSDSQYARDGVIVLKMGISNPFFRLFVSPVDLVFDLGTKRLVEIHGQSLLKRKVSGRVENPVVDIYYNYREQSGKSGS